MAAPYRNLVAWQRADDFFITVHRLTHQRFPSYERFELGAQIRRAAYSVPANIAEGNSRHHPRDAANFFNVASASLTEVGYGLHAATRLGYLEPHVFEQLEAQLRQVAAPLHGLIRRLRRGDRLLSQGTGLACWLAMSTILG